MNLTKRHKVFLAVFLVGLVALAADRTILRPAGGPRAASADPAEVYAVAQTLPADGVPALEDPSARTGLAERLAGLGSQKPLDFEQTRNPFALPPSWFGEPNATGEPVPVLVVRFVKAHQLGAVVMNGSQAGALVDDRFLVPGQILDGFTLVCVGDRSATFECEGMRAVLELVNQ